MQPFSAPATALRMFCEHDLDLCRLVEGGASE
jgi:hypothetical protein